jgi:hypothetical protein
LVRPRRHQARDRVIWGTHTLDDLGVRPCLAGLQHPRKGLNAGRRLLLADLLDSRRAMLLEVGSEREQEILVD